MTEQRRLAAILVADVVGYSKLVGSDEPGTLAKLAALRRDLIDPTIGKHSGRLFKSVGDGFLVEFASAVQAVTCAIEIQNAGPALPLRIGIHLGDVVVQGDDLMGDGVNVAARIESVADAGGIAISRQVRDQVRDKLDVELIDKGEVALKNIARPVRIFLVAGAKASVQTDVLALPDKPSIAVLPFQNMSGDPEQEYFADGLAEEIITALSRSRDFFVIARNSSFSYKGKSPDIRQVGRELGVHYVLEGSVRKAGDRLRITAQLIHTATGNHHWAERYDRKATDIFAIQDEITENVVASLEPQVRLAEGGLANHKTPTDLNAWGYVARAYVHQAMRSRDEVQTALELLERAIECDPRYARAHADLAQVQVVMAYEGWLVDRDQGFEAAAMSARRAIELDPNDAGAHFAKGMVASMRRQHREALPSLMKAVELNPNFAMAHARLGMVLSYLGRSEEGIEHTLRALRTSPRDPQRFVLLHAHGLALFVAARYAEAVVASGSASQDWPGGAPALRVLTAAKALHGDIAGAQASLRDLKLAQPEFSLSWTDANMDGVDDVRRRMLEGLRLAGMPE
jgi:adenylate cyclase